MSTIRELPAEPVDGFEVEWFSIGEHVEFGRGDARASRAVYHVNGKWADVVGESMGRMRGLDFVGQWQIFDAGKFSGRADGWTSIRRVAGARDVFPDRVAALEALADRIATELLRLRAALARAEAAQVQNARLLAESSRELA